MTSTKAILLGIHHLHGRLITDTVKSSKCCSGGGRLVLIEYESMRPIQLTI